MIYDYTLTTGKGGQAPGSDDEIHEFCTVHF